MTPSPQHTILLTFDVEDWFQVENLKECTPVSSWPVCELRVEKNVRRILDLLDSINCSTAAPNEAKTHNSILNTHNSPKATFFVLGWIAERLPHLVGEIMTRGHEIASHGYNHELCGKQPVEDLRRDLTRSRMLLEDITGSPVYGYRAPSFSIDNGILEFVRETGYLYDSSFNSFGLHGRYGRLMLNGNGGNGGNGVLFRISDDFFELPISNLEIGNRILPWGGGGYFRLLPAKLFRYGVGSILRRHGAYLFYLHPWEIDPGQPKVSRIRLSYRFRHYANLHKTLNKLSDLLKHLKGCHFQTCHQYIHTMKMVTGLS